MMETTVRKYFTNYVKYVEMENEEANGMDWVRKGLQYLFIFVCTACLLGQGATAQAADADKADLQPVFENMARMNGSAFSAQAGLETPMGNFTMLMNGEIKMIPVGYKGDMKMQYRDTKDREMAMVVQQYSLCEAPGILSVYTKMNGQWMLQKMPYTGLPAQDAKVSPEKAAREQLDMLKSCTIVSDTEDSREYLCRIDEKKMHEIADKVLQSQKESKDPVMVQNSAQQVAFFREVMDHMGELSYTMKVDKKTQLVTEMNMDLTTAMKNLSSVVGAHDPKMTEAKKKELQNFINQSTLKLQVKYLNHDEPADIVVPDEVKQSAKEIQPVKKTDAAQTETEALAEASSAA